MNTNTNTNTKQRLLLLLGCAILASGCAEDTGATRCGEGYCPKGFKCLERTDATPICAAASCGDGVKSAREDCDDGEMNSDSAPDACRKNCVFASCGDRVTDTGEDCDDGEETAACNADCTQAFCGDGYANAVAGEACDTGRDTEDCDDDCTLPACGDGYRNRSFGEECDDENLENGDGCSAYCLFEECGNGIVDLAAGEECDDGEQSSDTEPDACRTDCRVAHCGDGVKDLLLAETCDDGSTLAGDGCDEGCQQELGWVCTGDLRSVCRSICGDGIVIGAGGEECDDGNLANVDGCSAFCHTEYGWSCQGSPSVCDGVCGDGVVKGSETCDDGSRLAGDGCDEGCQEEEGWECTPAGCTKICGDGLRVGDEECDDGNLSNNDGCLNTCIPARCGDGIIRSVGSASEIEACDDGNNVGGDDCSAACQLEDCGNGVVDVGKGEECDDGNGSNGDWCPDAAGGKCENARCGDGFLRTVASPTEPAEECDDGNTANGDGCRADCTLEPGWSCSMNPAPCEEICQDGLRVGSETCDDRNDMDGDGCSRGCMVEVGWACDLAQPSVCHMVCGDGLKLSDEACDDSNDVSGDGCSASCLVEPGFICTQASPSECAALCGDGIVRGGEACDDGGTQPSDGCDGACQAEQGWTCDGLSPSHCASICSDGLVVGSEQCDDDNGSNGDGCPDGPGGTCRTAYCGDGFLRELGLPAELEGCDDGNVADHDGCSAACAVEAGWRCAGVPSVCTTICGDGVRVHLETCDDENTTSGDGCSNDCAVEQGYVCTGAGPTSCQPECGDSERITPETCDDGNMLSGDGCSMFCQVELGWECTGTGPGSCIRDCGDQYIVQGETCDDGDQDSGDGCTDLCQVEVGWSCVGTGPTSCAPICGDPFVKGDEECDLGEGMNTGAYGGCNPDCTLSPFCGDGVLNGVGAVQEECDPLGQVGVVPCSEVNVDYDAGTVLCTESCILDTSGCYRSCNNASDCVPAMPTCKNHMCVGDAGDACTSAIPISLTPGQTYLGAGNTASFSDDYDGSGCAGIPWADTLGPDQVWSIVLGAGQALRVELLPTGWDGLLYLTTSCAGLPGSCLVGWDRAAQAGVTERLHYVAPADQTLYLIVDGAAATDGGAYSLNVSLDATALPVDASVPLLITELMPDPAGHPYLCQWFEITNPTTELVDLQGLVLSDGVSSQPIDAPLLLGPGEALLFGTTGEPALNCGLPAVDWLYEVIDLDPVSPYLVSLETGSGSVIDRVSYDASWPFDDGYSAYLCGPLTQDASSNDDPTAWRMAPPTSSYSTASYGTPRTVNPSCP